VTAEVKCNRAEVRAGCHAGPGPPSVDIVTL
jgi:hypothetical protein